MSGFLNYIIDCCKIIICLTASSGVLYGQLLVPSDTFSKRRAVTVTATGLSGYGAGMYLLGNAWYKNSLTGRFHFFDDNGEWLQVDKVGHIYSAYNESSIVYDMYRWAGVPENRSLWLGLGAGMLAQTSLEVFDGFSDRWGFSWGDIAANMAGLGFFGLQQHFWHEQRMVWKVSSDFRTYPDRKILPVDGQQTDNLRRRASDLYSSHLPGRLLKDYNAQTNWLSVNPASFSRKERSWWPAYLNIAVGYSAENLFGGYSNAWTYAGHTYMLDETQYRRYRQYLLSLDIDLTRIPCRSPFLKTVLRVLNVFKLPAPALEYNSVQGLKGHWIFF